MLRAPKLPTCPPTSELYTPENIAKAQQADLTSRASAGVSTRRRLAELWTVQRLHSEIEELARRLTYGLTLPPPERRWPQLLTGPLQVLRAMMGAEEAAPFFVRHAVLPAALSPSVSLHTRRVFLREMRALPFSEQGKPLGAFPDTAELMTAGTYLFPSTPPISNPCPASKSKSHSKEPPRSSPLFGRLLWEEQQGPHRESKTTAFWPSPMRWETGAQS